MKTPLFKSDKNKRYYLHNKLKNKVIKFNAHQRTIYVNSDDELDIDVLRLRDKYGYNIQTQLLTHG